MRSNHGEFRGLIVGPVDPDESDKFLRKMEYLAAIGCLILFLYSLRFWSSGQMLRIFGVGLLMAAAALMSGYLLGFIFAIPRVGDGRRRAAPAKAHVIQPPELELTPDPVQLNGNLVEISDWLTKILVGVGLVELRSIPVKLGELSYYAAPALQANPCSEAASRADSCASGQAAVLAILIFYSAVGFLSGYVWTMIYFQGELRKRQTYGRQDKEFKQWSTDFAAITPSSKGSPILSAETFVAANQLDKGMASINETLNKDPENALALMTKARILKRQALQSGQPQRDALLRNALSCIDQAIELMPGRGEPIYNKACYQALLDPKGLKADVLENLKLAFRLEPSLRQVAQDDEDLTQLKDEVDFGKL